MSKQITEQQALNWFQKHKPLLNMAGVALRIGWARPDLTRWVNQSPKPDGYMLKMPQKQLDNLVAMIRELKI